MNLKEDNIKQITVETAMTEKKSEVALEKKEYKNFLDKISSYDILEKKQR